MSQVTTSNEPDDGLHWGKKRRNTFCSCHTELISWACRPIALKHCGWNVFTYVPYSNMRQITEFHVPYQSSVVNIRIILYFKWENTNAHAQSTTTAPVFAYSKPTALHSNNILIFAQTANWDSHHTRRQCSHWVEMRHLQHSTGTDAVCSDSTLPLARGMCVRNTTRTRVFFRPTSVSPFRSSMSELRSLRIPAQSMLSKQAEERRYNKEIKIVICLYDVFLFAFQMIWNMFLFYTLI